MRDKIHQERYKGAVVRARSERFLTGEQPTKRALADERTYALAKEIREIEHEGLLTRDENKIRNTFAEYYRNLFSDYSHVQDSQRIEYLFSRLPQLGNDARKELESPITIEEIEHVILRATFPKRCKS